MRLYLLIFFLLLFGFINAYAFEAIPITVSNTMNSVIFDGKWTFEYEWKASSLNTYNYDNDTQVILRSAHQDNFIYILLDPITDYYPDATEDHAIICFDKKNTKSVNIDSDDYCFSTYVDGDTSVYQGDSSTNNFLKIPNPEGFVAKSSTSDNNDRYTPIPHPTYEFRIPLSLIDRESVYGFYFAVYDAHSKKSYSYPIDSDPGTFVSNPSQWGEIYSPDKSLPEFELPLSLMIMSIFPVVLFTRSRFFGKFSK